MPEDVAVFAVSEHRQILWIDPVVIVHYGRNQRGRTIPAFNSPVPRECTEAQLERVENWLYKPGTLVSVFAGGEKLGSAAVHSSNIKDSGCVDLSAKISYGGTGKPRLATNTGSEIPGHVSTRRAATPAEASILRQLALEWLIDYGLDKQLLQRGRLGPVISTVLRNDAGRALAGRFDVTSKHAIHRLFAIAEQNQGRYELTLANLQIQRDVQDGTDITEREYVDQLDLDNDGLDEVVTSETHYESWSYTIWRFNTSHKVWQHAYTGGGGGV